MFHILIENSTPNRLVGGPWGSIRPESHSDVAPSVMECGLKGGQVREALSHSDVKTLLNKGSLNTERACKVCLRKIGGKYGKAKNQEADSRESNTN